MKQPEGGSYCCSTIHLVYNRVFAALTLEALPFYNNTELIHSNILSWKALDRSVRVESITVIFHTFDE